MTINNNVFINKKVRSAAQLCEEEISARFRGIDDTARINTERVLAAFTKARVSEAMFAGSAGYGYDDFGRETLDKVFAEIFGAESALVRIGFVNGTHAITAALFAALRPGQKLLSVMGDPYDTLKGAIGIAGSYPGSLKYYGIGYDKIDVSADGSPDLQNIRQKALDKSVGAVLIQRSRGYSARKALSIIEMSEIAEAVKKSNPNAVIITDNCYGEFCETAEPPSVFSDLCAGSLIKNPGGGLCLTGGYVCGREDLVAAAAMRLTTPGIGGECGATLSQNRAMFQGLFMAPHTVAQAMKTAVFAAAMFESFGFITSPGKLETRSDIIQTIELGKPERLLAFCRGIQSGSPVDSFVSPEPSRMPGYDCDIVMAAGGFIQGASIELSVDAPLREPFRAYMQGGLTYEAGRIGVMRAITEILDLQ